MEAEPLHPDDAPTGILYNDIDPFCCEWLRRLMAADLIPRGEVWCRSITEIQPHELEPYHTFHAFAGIGGWAYALRLAGWPDGEPVWTGSCPCQPFSVAGKQMGRADSRHLWPSFRRLINRREPPIVFGEQVASALGRGWLAGVCSDLETMGYSPDAADLCAAAVGSPIRRPRLFWMAFSLRPGPQGLPGDGNERDESRRNRAHEDRPTPASGTSLPEASGLDAMPVLRELPLHDSRCPHRGLRLSADRRMGESDAIRFWERFDALPCEDGWRRVEPGSFPLAHGVSGRVGRLRAYGNAIVPQIAAEFIRAAVEAMGDLQQ